LIKKLALVFNGVDLSEYEIGDVFPLPSPQAEILIGAGWAELVDRRTLPDRRRM
jgi:hypothetical protein